MLQRKAQPRAGRTLTLDLSNRETLQNAPNSFTGSPFCQLLNCTKQKKLSCLTRCELVPGNPLPSRDKKNRIASRSARSALWGRNVSLQFLSLVSWTSGWSTTCHFDGLRPRFPAVQNYHLQLSHQFQLYTDCSQQSNESNFAFKSWARPLPRRTGSTATVKLLSFSAAKMNTNGLHRSFHGFHFHFRVRDLVSPMMTNCLILLPCSTYLLTNHSLVHQAAFCSSALFTIVCETSLRSFLRSSSIGSCFLLIINALLYCDERCVWLRLPHA